MVVLRCSTSRVCGVGDDEWDSDGEKSASDLVTSPRSDQSPRGEGVTSSPLSSQSESGVGGEAAGDGLIQSSGPGSPEDQAFKDTVDATVRNLTERLSVSVRREKDLTSPSHSPSSRSPVPPASTSTKRLEVKRERASPSLPGGTKETSMKEEVSTPSLSPHIPVTRAVPSPSVTAADMEAARQQLQQMIQGLPLLSMLPALHRLAPAVVSLASGMGLTSNSITNSSNSSSNSSSSGGGILCVCGIRFSSVTNLEAHRMFYCAHRPNQPDSESSIKDSRKSPSSVSPRGENSNLEEEENSRVLKCPHCPYTTTHKLSLNGHMNIHTSPEEVSSAASSTQAPAPSQPTSTPHPTQPSPGDTRATDRYCSDCDIQFSSMKTFRVHKAHYCQTRHVLKGGNKSPAREDTAPSATSGLVNAAAGGGQPILALNTNPILLVPYSLIIGAQLLPPHVMPQAGAAVVLPNGQVQPWSPGPLTGPVPPPLLSPPAAATANRGTSPAAHSLPPPQASPPGSSITPPKPSPKNELRSKFGMGEGSGKRRVEGECPLDLTTKRPKLTIKTDLLGDEEKENREVNTPTPTKSPALKSRPGSSHAAGEFEGKLLASPSRPSPCSEGEAPSTRSPRPNCTTPALSSPRGLAESPRPSTSARSPAQTSALPQLPPGFPNLLASLESLGSLSLPALQSLQNMQGVPPELALKLLNPELLMNGLAPIVNPPVIVKQGEAKCNECNIVFYKEESLQVHKKHYCAARNVTKTEDERRPNGSRSPAAATEGNPGPTRKSPSTQAEAAAPATGSSVTPPKDTPKAAKPLFQFICTACGIKFNSPDNLAAHQTYYCSKREGSVSEEGVTKGLWRCPRCRCAMPETLQAAHQCVTPSPAPSHGWKCPCCPAISPTAAAAQKHLETHAGIKAFRCTICGYRGNTLRGMRTHIRMHFEKRTNDLQEENFIACILEDEEGGRRLSDTRGVTDLPRVILENPTLSALLTEGAVADHSDQPLSCHFCPFITPFRSNLARHLALAHKVGLESTLTQDLQAILEGRLRSTAEAVADAADHQEPVENGNPASPPPLMAIKLEPEVKLEVEEGEEKVASGPTTPHSPMDEDKPAEPATSESSSTNGADVPRHCKACNITFSFLDSFLAHKRFYCTKADSTTPPETAVQ